MGLLALSQFRTELGSILGNRSGITDERLDTWINLGYEELAGTVEFEELDSIIVIGDYTNRFDIPELVRFVKGLTTGQGLLQWVPQTEFMRIADNVPGDLLEYWTRIGNEIFLTPPVAATEEISVLAYMIPTPLVLATDKTVLPAGWDWPVLAFAISSAFMLLGDAEEGTAWYNRAVSFVQSRVKEENRRLIRPGLGATLPPDIRTASAVQAGA